ncbi:hypothetical protein G3M48_009558 [Beauveria asiatica]|uniref:Uncharacterized protein n=1 Tax=Beauveria asiatica TaxID=1069075 RepID=A0AAW0S2L3_9HYPO
MLRKIFFLISLVHIVVTDSLFEAYSTVTPTHRVIRRYRNSTSSAGSDTTIRELTLSTPAKTRQTTDHKSTSEVLPTVLGVDTRVTVEPSSSVAMVPTVDQSPDSTSSEKSKEEPATPDDPVFMYKVQVHRKCASDSGGHDVDFWRLGCRFWRQICEALDIRPTPP